MNLRWLLILALFFMMPLFAFTQEMRSIEGVDFYDPEHKTEIIVPKVIEMDYITTGELSLPLIQPGKLDLTNCKQIFASGKDKLGIVRTLREIESYYGYQARRSSNWHDDDSNTTLSLYEFMLFPEDREKMVRAFFRIEADGYYPVNAKAMGSEDWFGKKNNIPKMESCVSMGRTTVYMKKISSPIESFGKGFSAQVGEKYSLKYLADDPNAEETGWTFDEGTVGNQSPYDAIDQSVLFKEVLYVYPFDKKFKNPMSVTVQAVNSPHGFVVADGVYLNPETWTHQTIPVNFENQKYVFNINGGGIYYVITGGPRPRKNK